MARHPGDRFPPDTSDPTRAKLIPGKSYDHPRAALFLSVIFAGAVGVSIIHYTDNSVNFRDFPDAPESVPSSPAIVLGAWFAFTAAGFMGYLVFRRAPSNLALALLALYSGSGLVGIGHYLVPGAASMPWWRQAHVIADIACGIAMFSFVLWAARARPSPNSSSDVRQGDGL